MVYVLGLYVIGMDVELVWEIVLNFGVFEFGVYDIECVSFKFKSMVDILIDVINFGVLIVGI